ncbi:hypothetical protein BC941DRAFT_445452 [Chlamydoabsidia padenii]|nr:hypothetical protein BC941DRAFT_445452 [Chlamydoabsidia padenii]
MMTNNNNDNNQFNAGHILLRHPSSFMMDNQMMYQQDAKICHSPPYESEPPILDDVPQRLAPEQYQYEFPPKSHLQALSIQLDQSTEDNTSFFDASSFTTTTCTTSSTTSSSRVSSVLTDDFNAQEDQEFNSFLATLEMEQQQQQQQGFSLSPPPPTNGLVLDRQLSPLQLPQQTRLREESYDSISTITQPVVAPASFLSQHEEQEQVEADYYPLQDRIEWHDTFGAYPPLWQDTVVNDHSYHSVHPHHRLSEDEYLPVIRCGSEEMILSDGSSGEEEEDCHSHFSTGSKVVLIKLSKKTKMASPYLPSKSCHSDEGYDDNDSDNEKELPIESASVFLPLDTHDIIENNNNHTVDLLKQQIDRLESQLREEKAMRVGFEKAMEEMVILMDQQQKMLCDRVEQEVSMRQVYEKKMEDALLLVGSLQSKLKKETDARCELESMMSHVLGELQEIKQHQQDISTTSHSLSKSVRTTVIAKRSMVPNKNINKKQTHTHLTTASTKYPPTAPSTRRTPSRVMPPSTSSRPPSHTSSIATITNSRKRPI